MKHIVILLSLVAAIASCIAGSISGIVVFLATGLLLETVFWFRVFRIK